MRRSDFAGQSHAESAAFADLAFDANFAAVNFDQAASDGEAEAGASVLARDAAVGLREFFENRGQLFRRGFRGRCRSPECWR